MNTIPTTYFCATIDELVAALTKLGLEGVKAVRTGSEFPAHAPRSLPMLTDVIEGKVSFIIAQKEQDIAFVTASSWWRRMYLSLRNSRAPRGPSLQHSSNAVLLTIPYVNEACREIRPGFVSSYLYESKLYKQIVTELMKMTHRRDSFMVSPKIGALLDHGYKLKVG